MSSRAHDMTVLRQGTTNGPDRACTGTVSDHDPPEIGRSVAAERLSLGDWLRLWGEDEGQALSVLETGCYDVAGRIRALRSLGRQQTEDVRTTVLSAMVDKALTGGPLPGEVALLSYLLGIAKNASASLLRASPVSRNEGLDPDSVCAPEDTIAAENVPARSPWNLRPLTRRERQVVRLIDRLRSVNEVAQRLAVRPQSVRSVLRTAAKRVRLAKVGKRGCQASVVPEIPRRLRVAWPTSRQRVYRLARRHCKRATIARAVGRSVSAVREEIRLIRNFAAVRGLGEHTPSPPSSTWRLPCG